MSLPNKEKEKGKEKEKEKEKEEGRREGEGRREVEGLNCSSPPSFLFLCLVFCFSFSLLFLGIICINTWREHKTAPEGGRRARGCSDARRGEGR